MRALFFVLITLNALHLQAQIKGKVVDANTKEAISDATVALLAGEDGAITDSAGYFSLDATIGDSLHVSHLNFHSQWVLHKKSLLIIHLKPKSLDLNEVLITGLVDAIKIAQSSGSVGVISKAALTDFDETSVVAAMNTIPGVRMEQRSPGSYRINIRGSSLRAPFDVRNVKVYWNNIIYTEPGGNTPFNILDPANFNRIEIVKGPNGSTYGAGVGGVVVASNLPKASNTIEAGFISGSYGLNRYSLNLNFGDSKNQGLLNYTKQQADGYRAHSNFSRESIQMSVTLNPTDKSRFAVNALFTKLDYQIPGGLTKEQYESDARQARPGNQFTMGSVESNASIDVKNALFGLTYTRSWNQKWKTTTTVYTVITDFENPFIFDYKQEAQIGTGGRSVTRYSSSIGASRFELSAGIEYQTRFSAARNYENNAASKGALNFDDELRTRQSMVFIQTDIALPHKVNVSAGLSASTIKYNIFRLVDADLDTSFRIRRKFATIISPRLGLSKSLGKNTTLFGSISSGFSPPALEEVRTNEGSINTELDPERGVNFELGTRGQVLKNRLYFDVTLFHFNLNESIVDFTDNRGTDLFRNGGGTRQNGLEVLLNFRVLDNPEGAFSLINFQNSYTLNKFTFKDYTSDGEDYSGNNVPGVANNTWVVKLIVKTSFGMYLNVINNFTDNIPLNNENTVFANDYNLLSFKLGYTTRLMDKLQLNIYGGVNNVLDQKYSLGNDLNAFGGRYFQPSADRNYYAGIKLKYLLR